jgi:hypothetical protein
MKKLSLLLGILTLFLCFTAVAQNEKCLAFSTHIIKDAQGKTQNQAVDYNDNYFIKAEVPSTYDFEVIKTICDTNAIKTKVSFNWRPNSDRNPEKEYLIYGKKVLITFYQNDKFLYFEFPKE